MSETKHSPTPWKYEYDTNAVYDAHGEWVFDVVRDADAALIITAVNSHADLLAQVERLTAGMKSWEEMYQRQMDELVAVTAERDRLRVACEKALQMANAEGIYADANYTMIARTLTAALAAKE